MSSEWMEFPGNGNLKLIYVETSGNRNVSYKHKEIHEMQNAYRPNHPKYHFKASMLSSELYCTLVVSPLALLDLNKNFPNDMGLNLIYKILHIVDMFLCNQ